MSKFIPLTRGAITLVDDEDFEQLIPFNWYYTRTGYAARAIPRSVAREQSISRILPMHRAILNAPSSATVDHINGDTLDNRRANLRLANQAAQMANRGRNKNNTSGYKGVTWRASRHKWCAQIGHAYKNIVIGLFDTAEEAACAYNETAKRLFGEYCRLNEVRNAGTSTH